MKTLTEKQIIKQHTQAREKLDKAEDVLYKHFKKKHMSSIKKANTEQEITEIKEALVVMPYCASKVLMFRSIIIRENEIKNKIK